MEKFTHFQYTLYKMSRERYVCVVTNIKIEIAKVSENTCKIMEYEIER